jgi:hypothetical protein
VTLAVRNKRNKKLIFNVCLSTFDCTVKKLEVKMKTATCVFLFLVTIFVYSVDYCSPKTNINLQSSNSVIKAFNKQEIKGENTKKFKNNTNDTNRVIKQDKKNSINIYKQKAQANIIQYKHSIKESQKHEESSSEHDDINGNNLFMSLIKQSITEDNENLYWLFSASAQTLAAFIAFLLTGFSLVITLMNSIEEKDETLSDIMHVLKINYYNKIKVFSVITGIAIFLNLLSVYLNKFNFSYNCLLYILAVCFDVLSLIGAICVVLSIVNPDRIRKVAYSLYEQKVREVGEDREVEAINFIQKFIELEKVISNLIEKKNVFIERQYFKRPFLSFRNMIEILLRNEIIDQTLYSKLVELSKIRNYAVHGKIEKINKKYLDLIDEVLNQIKNVNV